MIRRTCRAMLTLTWVVGASASLAQHNIPVIAVADIHSSYGTLDSQTVRTALESSLSKTRKFAIMERARLDELLEERGLSISGIAEGNASLGGFSAVDYLVTGRLIEAAVVKGRRNGGRSLLGGLLGGGGGACEAVVGLDVRVVDTHTGQISVSESVAVAEEVAVNYPNYGTPDYSDPCRYANHAEKQHALTAAGHGVALRMAEEITIALFPIKLVRVQDDQAFVNYGSAFLSPGAFLRVVALGEGFVDPDTGEVLGAEEEELGYLAVSDVREKYAIADIVHTYESALAVGNVARRVSADEAKVVSKMLADVRKAKEKQQRACNDAQRRAERACRKDEQSSRCRKAEEAVDEACGLL